MASEPTHSIFFENRLIAYVWPLDSPFEEFVGTLVRAGHQRTRICDVPFAEIVSFMPEHENALKYWVEQTSDLEAFLFRLKVEGYDVKVGKVTPHKHQNRF